MIPVCVPLITAYEAEISLQKHNVVFYENLVKFERLIETYLAFAQGFKSFAVAMPLWIKDKLSEPYSQRTRKTLGKS